MGNQEPEQEVVEYKVRRATGINALRKIGLIVAEEQQADADNARALRWFVLYSYCVTKRSRDAVQGKIGRKSGVYIE